MELISLERKTGNQLYREPLMFVKPVQLKTLHSQRITTHMQAWQQTHTPAQDASDLLY